MRNINLNSAVTLIEDSIITLGGPALAISGIIAGMDLLTGGSILKQASWLAYIWAIALLLCLDFQVLALGARAHQIYLSDKTTRRKIGEIALSFIIAAAISFVSIQMQSIIARVNAVAGLSIEQAAAELGINPIWLIWERSALVLVLIFMSGWFREERSKQQSDQTTNIGAITANAGENNATDEAIKQLAEQVSLLALSVTQITTTVTEVKTTVTAISQGDQKTLLERSGANEQTVIVDTGMNKQAVFSDRGDQGTNEQTEYSDQGTNEQTTISESGTFATITQGDQGDQGTNTGERIRLALAYNPHLSDRELAAIVGCSSSTANKWRKRIEQVA